MGLFDFLRPKSAEEKKREQLEQLKAELIIPETVSQMNDFIKMSDHDDSGKDINPNGFGRFGLDKTNPIPVNGLDNIPAYMDKIRYKYVSQKKGNTTYNPVSFIRTSDNDGLAVGDEKPVEELMAAGISVDNIKGTVDVYNLYSIGNKLLGKVYINAYSLKTSNKIPDGFYHRDEVPAIQDSKVMLALMSKS